MIGPTLSLVALLAPALVAALAALRHPIFPRRYAVLGATVTLAIALAMAITVAATGPLEVDWRGETILSIDLLSATLAATFASLVAVSAIMANERDLAQPALVGMFALEALVLTTFCAAGTRAELVAWSLVGVPVLVASRAMGVASWVTRPMSALLVGSSLPLLALGLMGPLEGPALHLALAIAVVGRVGLVPLHSWFAPALAEAPETLVLPLVGACTGPYLLVRVAERSAAHARPIVGALAVVGAVYAALLALGERRLRYAMAYVVMSESAIVVAGLCTGDPEAMRGALMFSLAESFAATGLLVSTRAVVARVGSVDLATHHGLVRATPRLATAHLVFALAAIGFPGFAAYQGEDMLLEVAAHRQLAVVIPLVAVAALNGVTAFRAYTRTFLGPPTGEAPAGLVDLLPRKRAVLSFLLIAQIALGLLPAMALRYLPVSVARGERPPTSSPFVTVRAPSRRSIAPRVE